MTLLAIALADLRHRPWVQLLHVLLMSSGLALLVALLGVTTQLGERLDRNGRGIDAVVGARGSPLQLVLAAVHHLDVPNGTLPLAEVDRLRRDARVAAAIPLALGDSVRGFRIVGTTPALLAHYRVSLASGRIWRAPMEAVVGADVAASGLGVGQQFAGIHGIGSGRPHGGPAYRVTGVLARTGSIVDQLVLTRLDSVWALHAEASVPHRQSAATADRGDADHDHDQEADTEAEHAAPERRVTAVLIRYRSPLAALSFTRDINERTRLVAAAPATETTRLLALVGIGIGALRALAVLLLAASALSLLIAIVQSLVQRQHDLALFRCLGARRGEIALLLWLNAALPAAAATVLGLALGHAAIALLGLGDGRGAALALDPWHWATGETLLALLPLMLATVALIGPALRVYRADVAATLSGAGPW